MRRTLLVALFTLLVPSQAGAAALDPPVDCAPLRDADARQICAAANDGDAEALWRTAEFFTQGRRAPRNDATALRLLEAGAAQANPRAIALLGVMHAHGRGVERNSTEYLRLTIQAAAMGDALGQLNLGYAHLWGHGVPRNAAEALRLYRLSAAQGYPSGQYYLGMALRWGQGTTPDHAEAARLYRLAAEQGMVNALLGLGDMHRDGVGVERSIPEAIRLYTLAAAQDSPDANIRLGDIYVLGTDVPPNKSLGFKYWTAAMNQGCVCGAARLARAAVGFNRDEALKLAEGAMAMNPDHHDALDAMAYVLWVRGEPERALEFQTRALRADSLDPIGYERLGDILQQLGQTEKARRSWQIAMEIGKRADASRPAKTERLRAKLEN